MWEVSFKKKGVNLTLLIISYFLYLYLFNSKKNFTRSCNDSKFHRTNTTITIRSIIQHKFPIQLSFEQPGKVVTKLVIAYPNVEGNKEGKKGNIYVWK